MGKTKIISLIDSEFRDTKHPGDDNVFSMLISGADAVDIEDIKHVFIDKSWRNLEIEDLQKAHIHLTYLSPIGLQYFLPGIIRSILESNVEPKELIDSLIYYMTPPDDMSFTQFRALYWNRIANMEVPDLDSRFQKRVSGLNCQTIKIWVLFLQHLEEEFPNGIIEDEIDLEDVRNCLKYWEKLCE